MRLVMVLKMGLAISMALFFVDQSSAKNNNLEERVLYLEQVIENHNQLLKQFVQLNTLQEEIRQLRGMLEVQGNDLKILQQYQIKETRVTPTTNQTINIQPNDVDIKADTFNANLLSPKVTDNNELVGLNTEEMDYQKASQLLQNVRYIDAIVAFEQFLTAFPTGQKRSQAYYWLGEAYFMQWQSEKNNQVLLEKAANSFLALTQHFPTDGKVPDALLKLGILATERNQKTMARQYYSDLKYRFPTSSAARLADIRLQRLDKEEQFLSP